jgi:peptidoglycan/xylan/chitin deacetylase (PgdA/CDA1 family)
LQEGYEPASEHWNVGVGLRAWSIRELLRSGLCEYDFLAGIGRHKTDWGAEVKESRRAIVAAPTYKNMLLCRGPEWQERAKGVVKTLVPKRVLALHRAGVPQRVPRQAGIGSREFVRRAAARCYFHLGMPAVMQRLRKQYQLSIAPNGSLPHISVRKRREPAGRIFCYHRVNDERDPFFPSMPVDTFEQQMRFVAQRHRVVSLSELMVHLQSGSPETVLALTFDDGYRDNYQNAFPILQRYGLPATIFLTTGCLDTGEPLWFERLGAAVKTTSKEYIDVEIDLPRRFLLRTPEERLHSNRDLFALLRQVSNDERQRHLATLLLDLATPASDQRKDVMLTWDQVRHMKHHKVDFGGHTVTHPILSQVPPGQVEWEIAESKRRIETELQAPVRHFAYPNGRDDDFAPSNKEAIRLAGYQAAVTTVWGLNYASTDRLELRRSGPWEEDEALFAYKMDWYELVNG